MLFERKDRHVVPRWRDFKTTLALGELQHSKESEPIGADDQEAIARRIEEFQVESGTFGMPGNSSVLRLLLAIRRARSLLANLSCLIQMALPTPSSPLLRRPRSFMQRSSLRKTARTGWFIESGGASATSPETLFYGSRLLASTRYKEIAGALLGA